jgi:hypothetical protein
LLGTYIDQRQRGEVKDDSQTFANATSNAMETRAGNELRKQPTVMVQPMVPKSPSSIITELVVATKMIYAA